MEFIKSLNFSEWMVVYTLAIGALLLIVWYLIIREKPNRKPTARQVSAVPRGVTSGDAGPGLYGIGAVAKYGKNLAAATAAAPQKPDPQGRLAQEIAARQRGKDRPSPKK